MNNSEGTQVDWEELKRKIESARMPAPKSMAAPMVEGDVEDEIPVAQAAPIIPPPMPDPEPIKPAVKDYLTRLREAQDQVKDNQLGSGLGMALGQLTHAISRAPGQADLTAQKALAANDNAPVTNLLQEEKIRQAGDKAALYKMLAEKKFQQAGERIEQSGERLQHQKEKDAKGKSLAERRIGLAEGREAVKAGDRITDDQAVKQLTSQLNLTKDAIKVLNKQGLTNQEFNDVQIELSNAISGARSAALGKLERTEYESVQQKLSDIVQKITGQPQDAVPPELAARLKLLAQETADKFALHREERAKSKERGYGHNPAAKAEQDKAIEQYKVQEPAPGPDTSNLVERKDANGRIGLFDKNTKKFMGYK